MLEWSRIFCTGHDLIDRDHQKIFMLSNELYAARHPKDRQHCIVIAHETLEFLKQHFTHEEKLLEGANASGLAHHRQTHRGILAKLNDLYGQLVSGQGEPKELLFYLVYEEIIYHMLDYDRALKPVSANLKGTEKCEFQGMGATPWRDKV